MKCHLRTHAAQQAAIRSLTDAGGQRRWDPVLRSIESTWSEPGLVGCSIPTPISKTPISPVWRRRSASTQNAWSTPRTLMRRLETGSPSPAPALLDVVTSHLGSVMPDTHRAGPNSRHGALLGQGRARRPHRRRVATGDRRYLIWDEAVWQLRLCTERTGCCTVSPTPGGECQVLV